MRKSRMSRVKQNRLMEHFVAGTTARCASDLAGVNRKTAAYYYNRLGVIISEHLEDEASEFLSGEIEVDESYFGGRRKGKRGRGAGGKTPVFGLLKRGGRVIMCWMYRNSDTIESIIQNCLPTSRIISTGSRISGIRRNGICGNSTAFQRITSPVFEGM